MVTIDEGPYFMPDIVVNVRGLGGEESVVGIVREVLINGSCRIVLGDYWETMTTLPDEMGVVAQGKMTRSKLWLACNCREFHLNPNLWETKQIEKTHAKEKQSHAQDNIYVIQQFAYVHGVAGISLLSGKNTEYNLRL